jgi:hypothetical protein
MIIFEFVHGTYLLNSDLFVKLGQLHLRLMPFAYAVKELGDRVAVGER